MTKKLFITDFDGTLLRDDKTISQKDIKILERLQQNGVFVAIATGRSSYSFEKTVKILGMSSGQRALPVDYVIFSTGAGIMTFKPRKLLIKKEIKPGDIEIITQIFDMHRFDYMVHQAIPDTRHFLYKTHTDHNLDFQARLRLYPDFAVPLKSGHSHSLPATEVLAIIPPGKVDKKKIREIKRDLGDFSVIQATSPLDHVSLWIEIFHKDVSKSTAAIWLSRELGVDKKDMVAVGNDYNDQDLLAAAGKGFVVENAPVCLRQTFRTVASNNHNGVSQAVKAAGLL